MSDLIPQVTITEFRKLQVGEIRRSRSVEVMADGIHLFTAIIPKGDMGEQDYIKANAEVIGMRSNMSMVEDPAEKIHAAV